MLSDQAATILGLIADGRSYDQILRLHPDLTYLDIFAAARQALDLAHGVATTSAPAEPTEQRWDEMGFGQILAAEADEQASWLEAAEQTATTKPSGKPSFIEKARATHPRAFTRWTRDEDSRLRDLFAREAPISEIGGELGRHNGAIRSRLVKLGLLADDQASEAATQDDRLAKRNRSVRKQAPVTESPAPAVGPVPGWESIRSRLAGDAP